MKALFSNFYLLNAGYELVVHLAENFLLWFSLPAHDKDISAVNLPSA